VYFLSLLNKVKRCSYSIAVKHQPMNSGYLTNTGCQVISMAQFVQTHLGGKALLTKATYLKIRDGKECTF